MSVSRTHFFLTNGPAWDLELNPQSIMSLVKEYEEHESSKVSDMGQEVKEILSLIYMSNLLDDSNMRDKAMDNYWDNGGRDVDDIAGEWEE